MSKSGLDFSALRDLAQAPDRDGWAPLVPTVLHPGLGLFFDQSLTNTGWVELHVSKTHTVMVLQAGVIKPEVGETLTGFALDCARGTSVFNQVIHHQGFAQNILDRKYNVVAAETPPIGFKVKGDGTSSRVACQVISDALWVLDQQPLTLIQSQAAKKTMTGKGAKVDKAQAHRVMQAVCYGWITGAEKVTNEHTRDALMNGLHWFARMAS